MNNYEVFNETDENIDIDEEKKIINFALKHENLNNVIFNVIFVDRDKITELNRDYRGIDRETDVISFALEDGEANFIVTSPPYVTSYEYADLHQLPSLWFGYLNTLPEFREKFIGSSYKEVPIFHFFSKSCHIKFIIFIYYTDCSILSIII